MHGSTSTPGSSETSPLLPFNRRQFLSGAVAAAGSLGAIPGLAADAASKKPAELKRKLKIGLIGCGSRGSWITKFFQKHGGYQFQAIADYSPETAEKWGETLGVEKSRRFSGLGGYKKLIDSGVDAVVIEDVPAFYPEQAKAAVEAGCHVYMAKPVAVDVPGCLTVEAAAKLATEKQRCLLVDYQLPTQPEAIEVASRIRDGGLGKLAHIVSYGVCNGWADPPKDGPRDQYMKFFWHSQIALGGDAIVLFDIHAIDVVTWVMGKRPVGASGHSRICRPDPNGNRVDCGHVSYEYDDGTLWGHTVHAMNDNCDMQSLSASFFGSEATAHLQYGGKVYVRGGSKHYVGTIGSLYDDGVARNVAEFYKNVTEGHFENPTAKRAIDGHLAAILGREASARRQYLTMDELIKENKKVEFDLTGLKA